MIRGLTARSFLLAISSLGLTHGQALAQMQPPPAEMVDPGATGRRIAEKGVLGNFYPAARAIRHPAVLLLGGSEGGLGSAAKREALALQAAGYNVLQLAYFRAPGYPQALAQIPLETFDRGLDWLKAQPAVNSQRLAILGSSKGAEAALLVASRRPDITVVVAGMPSSVAWPAFGWGDEPVTGASWTSNGMDLATVPNTRFDALRGVASVYDGVLTDTTARRGATIPIERSTAAVLLVCGGKDTIWPSCPMAEQLRARDKRVTVLQYPDAGHAVFGVPLISGTSSTASLAQYGGTGAANAAARKIAWPKVIAFLAQHLVKH